MQEIVGNYLVEIGENSIEVVPLKEKRLKPRQFHTWHEAQFVQPVYVRNYVYRKLQYIGYVYLYHFDRRYPNGKRPQHYLGFAKNVELRELRHLAGNGARLMQVVSEAGISWTLVKVWVGDRYFERKLKREGHFHRHCLICKQNSLRPLSQIGE